MSSTEIIVVAAVVITTLTSLFKDPRLGGLVRKIPKRARIVIPLLLSVAAGLLSNVALGLPWEEALQVTLFSGPSAVFLNHDIVHNLLGVEHKEK